MMKVGMIHMTLSKKAKILAIVIGVTVFLSGVASKLIEKLF